MEREQNQKWLRFCISNKTQDDTLVYHRFERDFHRSPELKLELLPGRRDGCQIFSDPDLTQATERLVVYWAESFTLAIFVHISEEAAKFLQLELSREKAHLRDLSQTFSRMSKRLNPPEADRTSVTACEFSGQGKVSVWLLAGRYKVTATMSHYSKPNLKVLLEEQARS